MNAKEIFEKIPEEVRKGTSMFVVDESLSIETPIGVRIDNPNILKVTEEGYIIKSDHGRLFISKNSVGCRMAYDEKGSTIRTSETRVYRIDITIGKYF